MPKSGCPFLSDPGHYLRHVVGYVCFWTLIDRAGSCASLQTETFVVFFFHVIYACGDGYS